MGKGSRGFLGRARVKATLSKDDSVLDQSTGEGRGVEMKLEGPSGPFDCWAGGEVLPLQWDLLGCSWFMWRCDPWDLYCARISPGAVQGCGRLDCKLRSGGKGTGRRLPQAPERDSEPSSGFTQLNSLYLCPSCLPMPPTRCPSTHSEEEIQGKGQEEMKQN